MLGSTRNDKVSPLTWKSRTILNPTKSVKDAETRALSIVAGDSPHFARMIERLLFGTAKKRIPVKCFSDNRPLLETIASTKSPINKDLNDTIRYLKDKLSWEEVGSYSWLPTKRMISDFLTKEMKIGGDVWDIFRHNHWKDGKTTMNLVTVNGIEFMLSNPTTKEDEDSAG